MVASKRAKTVPMAPLAISKKPSRPPTPFEHRLYAACKAIPRGKVATYGQLAALLNSAPRAVGQALRRNPFAPVVPCHRVITSSLELGGFDGSWVGGFCGSNTYSPALVHSPKGPDNPNGCKKLRLLQEEGVRFVNGKLANKTMLTTVQELRQALQE